MGSASAAAAADWTWTTVLVAAGAGAAVILVALLLRRREQVSKRESPGRLPPGPWLVLPVVGHTLGLLRALRGNTAEAWLRRWTAAYGPVVRLSLFGRPTAFLAGASANRFLFSSPAVAPRSHKSFVRMVGSRSIREVTGDEHRRVRAMMVQFLWVDAVRGYVAAMDGEVRRHLDAEWRGRRTVAVMPSMKSLTFGAMCTVLFRLDSGSGVRRELDREFRELIRGIWATPVKLPFTTYGRCLAAGRRGRRAAAGVVEERRARLRRGEASAGDDVVTHMLAEGLGEEEIMDNVMFLMVAAHDTTAALLTFMVRHLEANGEAYERVAAEQREIARSKSAGGEALSWEDLGRMRYTWAAAQETLRLVPPVFSNVRHAVADAEFGGYRIPKGWQVLHAANTTQWDPAVFPDPSRFEPERFLQQQSSPSIPPYTFIPFGGGARICPGNEFARVETLVAMHHMVTRYSWKLAAGCDGSFSRHPLPSLPGAGPPHRHTPCYYLLINNNIVCWCMLEYLHSLRICASRNGVHTSILPPSYRI